MYNYNMRQSEAQGNYMSQIDFEVYTLKEFLLAHKISRATFYRLIKNNKAPAIIKFDKKILISKKAAEEWREKMTKKNSI
jgi:predicted DNA-binding transcriptional regulator AlpA